MFKGAKSSLKAITMQQTAVIWTLWIRSLPNILLMKRLGLIPCGDVKTYVKKRTDKEKESHE